MVMGVLLLLFSSAGEQKSKTTIINICILCTNTQQTNQR